jgi:type I restriction enzyme R subunit
VLGEKDGKKRFADTALAMSKAFSLCCTLDEAKAVREEVAFFQAVKVILTKRELSQQKRTDEQRELAIRQIINSAVVSGEVVDIFAAVGLDKPNIGLLDDAFLAQVDLTRFHRHISASSTKLLECQRAQKVKMTVPADSIVETLNVIKHV